MKLAFPFGKARWLDDMMTSLSFFFGFGQNILGAWLCYSFRKGKVIVDVLEDCEFMKFLEAQCQEIVMFFLTCTKKETATKMNIYIYTHPKTNIDAQNDGPWKR